jgi:Flp pilus assembly protein TadD
MLAYLKSPDSDEVFSASLIRLLRDCPDRKKWTGILKATQSPSALVRASAAETLGHNLGSTDALVALFKALKDDSRLVRVRAAASLAQIPPRDIQKEPLADLRRAEGEFIAAMRARPDDPASLYNLGNYYLDRRQYQEAVNAYETALKLEPEFFPALLNAAMSCGLAGDDAKNMAYLRRAQKLRPEDVAVNLNLGLLLGQQKRFAEAETALRAALKADPQNAVAAYNLGVILAAKDPGQAIQLISQAARLRPDHPPYAYAVAFYLRQNGREAEAVEHLRRFIQKWPELATGYLSLGEILEKQGQAKQAAALYRQALKNSELTKRERLLLMNRLQKAESRQGK